MSRRAARLAKEGETTVGEVQRQIGLSSTTITKYLKEERDDAPRLKGTKRGGVWYVTKASLAQLKKDWPNLAKVEAQS